MTVPNVVTLGDLAPLPADLMATIMGEKPVRGFDASHVAFIERAIAGHDAVLKDKPDDLHANYNKALLLLSIGRFEEGWPLFEWRLEVKDSIFKYDWFPIERWDRGDITGKNVLVWLEQGIGDQVMAVSMIPQLAAKAKSVVLMADRRFGEIFARSFPNVEFYKTGCKVPARLKAWDFDCQLSVSDLGSMFRKSFAEFTTEPYLKADPVKMAALRRKYLGKSDGPLIGFSWMSANQNFGLQKSIPPAYFLPLAKMPGATYVSLQYGDHDIDKQAFRDLGADFIDDKSIDPLLSLDDCAAQIAACDMVISVSNSTVHLAGAMGVPVHALVPLGHGRVWYWHTGMNPSPWYPSVQIHRCEKVDDWSYAINSAWQAAFKGMHNVRSRAA